MTNQSASPDTIRLWLERSGRALPLDIEIFLRVNPQFGSDDHGVPPISRSPSPAGWTIVPPPHGMAHYVYQHAHTGHPNAIQILPPSHTPAIIVSPNPQHHPWASPSPPCEPSGHWGHIVFYYLVQQMRRWERFVFRYDKQFPTIAALKSIAGTSYPCAYVEVR